MAAASDMDGLVRRDLYVYYQVAEADASALAAKVRAMQQALGAGQLKRRPAANAGLLTLMEIYAGVTADFAARLDAAVAEFGVLALTAGARHLEIFIDLDLDLDHGKPAPCA